MALRNVGFGSAEIEEYPVAELKKAPSGIQRMPTAQTLIDYRICASVGIAPEKRPCGLKGLLISTSSYNAFLPVRSTQDKISRFKHLPYGSRNREYIRLIFAYTESMFYVPTSGIPPFVIVCKGCEQKIPAPVQTMPDLWIVADCPLCGEKRRYLPQDILRGRLSHELLAKPPRIADWR